MTCLTCLCPCAECGNTEQRNHSTFTPSALAAELAALIERKQMLATAKDATSHSVLAAAQASRSAKEDIGQFICENWPTILTALRTSLPAECPVCHDPACSWGGVPANCGLWGKSEPTEACMSGWEVETPELPGDVGEMFDLTHGLIQEAKGADGPNGCFVTDHLDAAENWLDQIEETFRQQAAQIASLTARVDGLREAMLRTQMTLEAIVHHNSTDFKEVHERIIANRLALTKGSDDA